MTVCHVCQHNNPSGAEYCEECGASLTPVGAATGATAGQSAAAVSSQPPAVTTPGTLAPAAPPLAAEPPAAGVPPAPPASDGEANDGQAVSQPEGGTAAPPATESASAARPARLVVIRHGAPSGEEMPLLGDRMVIGRFDPETGPVDIDLSSAPEAVHVSRQHGELRREPDGAWTVRDLGSTNGIFVKGGAEETFGPRISQPRPLTDGDELAFGNARFVFRTS